ncbi:MULTISPECIES: serine/threonine-protein kinase [unclassified Leptolyngbya]|uniref:serine/threonine-protein kinase n=1 Tax=unclassified Leptolyngbya TaxID=2650499 RepID=UPI00168286D9|nr:MULTISPECIES: serine/threonine-protein kinase [unclassified Leptolyngbya]MBD1911567.1 serine/threonine protein kinase [Leptolyngbya sp. FACHB-8]MBD2155601.1 serine/threonine protein kinase [Leptolyngbya sp. FACHB-16]
MDFSTAILNSRRSNPQGSTDLNGACGTEQRFRDRYQVIKALGRGGFGVTFLAQDMLLPGNPYCVIKQLCPKVNNDVAIKRACERFEREAKILSQLGSHAQIPRLLDYFQVDGEFYLVQEYVPGNTLAKEIKKNGPQSESYVKRFLREILPILDYVHKQQVIHRDIKPPNIIRCDDDGRLVLIDFGAVKEEIVENDRTGGGMTTQFVGTLGFAPPEQLAMRPTFSSDIYAVGVTCLYLLTGKPPMEFDYDPLTGELRWEQEVYVSDFLARILDKMLKVSVSERYHTVEQVQRALELESYMDNLADCMTTKRQLTDSVEEDSSSSSYSPFSRTAEQIRQWRSRLRQHQKKQRKDLLGSEYNSRRYPS